MQGGIVPDLSSTSFGQLFEGLGTSIADEQHAENRTSKANRLRVWLSANSGEGRDSTSRARGLHRSDENTTQLSTFDVSDEQLQRVRDIAGDLRTTAPSMASGGIWLGTRSSAWPEHQGS